MYIDSVNQIIEDNLQVREALSDSYEGLNELLFIVGNGCGDYYSYSIEWSNKIGRDSKVGAWRQLKGGCGPLVLIRALEENISQMRLHS